MFLTGNLIFIDQNFECPPSNPLSMLQCWLKTADQHGINEPRGMTLSTVDDLCRPSSRTVLIKECDEKGVIFVTSQTSAKGKNLDSHPWVAGTIWWRETIQQINFQGQVTKLSDKKSDELFQVRPRAAQAVAEISQQSALLTNEQELKNKVVMRINSDIKISRPKGWYAYKIIIESIEFWYGNKERFHRRLRYNLINDIWQHQRLQP